MRTSNKILLGVFVTMLVVLTAMHGAIYAKYKSNDFINARQLHEERYHRYNIDGVQSVLLTGMEHVTIFPSDSARLEIEKTDGRQPGYTFANGVLTIKGDTIITNNDGSTNRQQNYREMIIYLPYTQNIKSDFCRLFIHGANNPAKPLSMQLELVNTDLQIGGSERPDTSATEFRQIVATKVSGGTIGVLPNVLIRNFEVHLQAANFNDGGASFDSLTVYADDDANISLTGKNIPKTKIISKP